MRLPCNFHFHYVTDKILFSLRVYFTRIVSLSFLIIFRSFRQENRIVFYWSKSRDRKENEIFASQVMDCVKTCKAFVIGREITTMLKIAASEDVAAFTFAVWQIRSCLLRQERRFLVYLQFCLNFLWIYEIEVDFLAVWSKRVKRFKGKLIIYWGKQELARTCSVYVYAQDIHSKFTVVA